MRSRRRGLRLRNSSTASTQAASSASGSSAEREGSRFEAAVAALGGTQDIRLEGSIIIIVSSCAAPPGGARRQPSRSPSDPTAAPRAPAGSKRAEPPSHRLDGGHGGFAGDGGAPHGG